MEKEAKFRVGYDYKPDEVVGIIKRELKEFGLTIVTEDGDDDSFEYKIVKINDQKEKAE